MYSTVDPGTRVFRSRKKLNYSIDTDITFGKVYPVFYEFVVPNDVMKISARVFIRYQPTSAPILNRCTSRMRYFFIPLRLIEENAETVITGSNQGQAVPDLPVLKNFVADVTDNDNYVCPKGEFWDTIGIPCLDYKNIKTDRCLPAQYWYKAYRRVQYDFYRDENIATDKKDFKEWYNDLYSGDGANAKLFYANIKKDYLVSATPFELKGEIPTFDVVTTEPFSEGSGADIGFYTGTYGSTPGAVGGKAESRFVYSSELQKYMPATESEPVEGYDGSFAIRPYDDIGIDATGTTPALLSSFRATATVPGDRLNELWSGFSGSFNMRDIRRMSALTRIKERDMRCGSRYTEYLRANFHTAPADETLQRPVYLGGFKQPIVTNEVLQTGPSDSTPVGMLRGKGISDGGNTISTYRAKEFGVILGLLDVLPETLYTQGIDRKLTYISRYDFFNPSFQNLSEQEIRNGEVYVSNSDGKNDETFGFQGMYNEMRSRKNIVTGDLRGGLKYWTQAVEYASRPNWNENFISSESYETNYKRPFAVINANPMILHVDNINDAYRPMVSEPVPGLVDHN